MIPFFENPLTLTRGRDYSFSITCTTGRVIYRPVTAIEKSAPVRLTVPTHGLLPRWAVTPIGRAGSTPLLLVGPQFATIIDADTVELNGRHSLDWQDYVDGAQLAYNEPLSLASYTATLKVYQQVNDPLPLFTLSEGEGLSVVYGSVSVAFEAAQTLLIQRPGGSYALSIADATGNYLLAYGAINLLNVGLP